MEQSNLGKNVFQHCTIVDVKGNLIFRIIWLKVDAIAEHEYLW